MTSPRRPKERPGPNSRDELADLLTRVACGQLSANEALSALAAAEPSETVKDGSVSEPPHVELEQVTLDLDRERRCGFPEVIYGQGKPAEMIIEIIETQRQAGQNSLATRVSPETADRVLAAISDARFNRIAKTIAAGTPGTMRPEPLVMKATTATPKVTPHVAVITAGSTDAPVAEEAIETLHWMGIPFCSYDDIGVAGPARLLSAVPSLRQASVAIVIAGMEGALPAAVGGHLSVPVFAVPTSVGYGATLGGLTPMLGMLSSCASNVAVVNIDAGFKAAYLAGLVVNPLAEMHRELTRQL